LFYILEIASPDSSSSSSLDSLGETSYSSSSLFPLFFRKGTSKFLLDYFELFETVLGDSGELLLF